MFFNEQESINNAIVNQGLTPAPGRPTDFWQNFSAAWDSNRRTNTTIARDLNRDNAYSEVIDQLKSVGAGSFENPYNTRQTFDYGAVRTDEQFMRDYGGGDPEENFWLKVEQWRKEHPDQAGNVLTRDQFEERAKQIGQEADTQEQETAGLASGGLTGGQAGSMLGGMAAIMSDPPVALSSLFGAGPSVSVLRGIATEVAIATITETGIQPFIQEYRKELGLPHGWEQAAENIASAGAGAAALYPLFRGITFSAKSVAKLLRGKEAELSPIERQALKDVEQRVHVDEETPTIEPTREDLQQHRQNLDETIAAITEERQPNIREPESFTIRRRDLLETTSMRSLPERLTPYAPSLLENELFQPVISAGEAVRVRLGVTMADRAAAQARTLAREADAETANILNRLADIETRLSSALDEGSQVRSREDKIAQFTGVDEYVPPEIVKEPLSRQRLQEIDSELLAPALSAKRRNDLINERRRITSSLDKKDIAANRAERSKNTTRVEQLMRERDQVRAQYKAARERARKAETVSRRATRPTSRPPVGNPYADPYARLAPVKTAGNVANKSGPGDRAVVAAQAARMQQFTDSSLQEYNAGLAASIRASVEEFPDRQFPLMIEQPDGSVLPGYKTGKEILEELDADEKSLTEFEGCYANAAPVSEAQST